MYYVVLCKTKNYILTYYNFVYKLKTKMVEIDAHRTKNKFKNPLVHRNLLKQGNSTNSLFGE